jgi:phage-related baseplate assembly protein
MANIDLFVVDDEEIHNLVVDYVEKNLDETLYPGDERKIFLEVMQGFFTSFLVKLNELFNQRFAQYAKGTILDAHGENENCERLAATKSHTVVRFSIGTSLGFNVVIPKGTRITADNDKYFETEEVAVIYAGSTYVDVNVSAVEGGSAYNGFTEGQINKLVDRVEYISTVSNLETTAGGDDGEPYPEVDGGVGDTNYYERIRLSKSAKSTAGAETLYKYYAKSADASISDVFVSSDNTAGTINLTVCCKDGAIPTIEILDKVLAACNAKDVRPLGDKVEVSGIAQASYDIELVYYTTEDEESDTVAAVEGVGGAIDRYNTWQSAEIGRAINPDRLRAEILKSDTKTVGADYVEITKPVYTVLGPDKVAKWSGNMTVTHKTTAPGEG